MINCQTWPKDLIKKMCTIDKREVAHYTVAPKAKKLGKRHAKNKLEQDKDVTHDETLLEVSKDDFSTEAEKNERQHSTHQINHPLPVWSDIIFVSLTGIQIANNQNKEDSLEGKTREGIRIYDDNSMAGWHVGFRYPLIFWRACWRQSGSSNGWPVQPGISNFSYRFACEESVRRSLFSRKLGNC